MSGDALRYLVFDLSDDDHGNAAFEAMATVRRHDTHARAAVQAEIDTILAWAEREFPGQRGALEDGRAWDALVQHEHEADHVSITLSLAGTAAFAQAFTERFSGGLG